MRKFGKILGRVLLGLFLLIGGAWFFAPPEPVDREISFYHSVLGDDLDAYLAASELKFPDIRPGDGKQIHWAGAKGARTEWAIVYIHGFSASPAEIRPVPDKVAAGLGANLFLTRLAGHGRTSEAMAEPLAGDWLEDFAEAMAIGRRLGDKVLVISTSTGGPIAALGAADPDLSEGLAGLVFVSPNFGVKSVAGRILDMPFARVWGPLVAGKTRSFAPHNPQHGAHWTTSYPTVALFPMSAIVRAANRLDLGQITQPALVLLSAQDQVVDPARTEAVMARWGGPVTMEWREMGPGDDANSHVIAGDIMSPGQTEATVQLILSWVRGL